MGKLCREISRLSDLPEKEGFQTFQTYSIEIKTLHTVCLIPALKLYILLQTLNGVFMSSQKHAKSCEHVIHFNFI